MLQQYLGACGALKAADVQNPSLSAAGLDNPTGTMNDESGQWCAAHVYWANGRVAIGATANTALTPNSMYPDCFMWAYKNLGPAGAGLWGSRSFHNGGVNTLFGDGSVKFIRDQINPLTWWAISTVNQGEVVSADQY
jgi:prepilin-type processing-associated H-X9-DG protein